MAILKANDRQCEIQDGSPIMAACEELGVPFGCTKGICGTCTTVVKKGIENLSEMNEKENAMGLTDGERLMCQCKIVGGEVELEVF